MSQTPLQEVELYAFTSNSALFHLTAHEFDALWARQASFAPAVFSEVARVELRRERAVRALRLREDHHAARVAIEALVDP